MSVFVFSLAAPLTQAQAGSDYLIRVILDKTKQMALINPDTKSVVSYVPLPVMGSHGVVTSPDQKYLYINAMPPADIVEYDIAKKGVSKWFPIPETTKNCGILVAPDGKHVISASQNKKVIVLDRITGKYDIVKTPSDSHQFTFGPDGNVYVAGGTGNKVYIIDWKKRKMVGEFKVGKVPHGVAFSPDKKNILVSLRGESRVGIYDAKSKKEVGSIEIKDAEGLCNIGLMPDNKSYWVAETFGRRLHQIDAKTNEVIHSMSVDGEPHHALATPLSGN
ncbi:MAG: YncE family protein [Nitrospinota bacterium]|nr:YncE family protein [Nitrospinota bacterium]